MIIEVTFKGNRREFFEWPFSEPPVARTGVIVEAERGEDFGRVYATGDLAARRKSGTTHGKASPDPLRKAIRAASGDDVARADGLRVEEREIRARTVEKVRALGLAMKVSDMEWQWDKKRLTVYFTAEERVDFRNLVRQLEGMFGTRVHMWHIGVRDEAKRVDGVGRCGRQLCSASWLPELVPVKSSVAKDQHLSTLNPAQISGACGRLMCCLRYEHEFYVQQRKRFPKEGKIVTTVAGEEKVSSIDIFRETVTLRSPTGELRIVPLGEFRQQLAPAQPGAPAPVAAAVPSPPVEIGDEDRGNEKEAVEAEAQGEQPQGAPSLPGQGRRRRRGRRGGRRGRGPQPPGGPQAPPADGGQQS